jgi:hypothetical protein
MQSCVTPYDPPDEQVAVLEDNIIMWLVPGCLGKKLLRAASESSTLKKGPSTMHIAVQEGINWVVGLPSIPAQIHVLRLCVELLVWQGTQ